jgi:FADH2 O2-dependent halogenase
VARLAKMLEEDWEKPGFEARLQDYAEQTDKELLATARLIGALYSNMNNFPVFVALTLLYFAAASFSETARRLGKPELASSFLLCNDPVFGPASSNLIERARGPLTQEQSLILIRDIHAAIEPIDMAGLRRSDRGNWYPVNAQDLFDGAGKLSVTRAEIEAMLQRCGFMADREPVLN